MSEPEGFLSRWTRLKHEAGETPEPASKDATDSESREGAPQAAPDVEAEAASAPEGIVDKPTIDLSVLPAIESITATTDIRAFLAPGVPAELTRAALRRAWVVDPKIRDFVGIADYQWDFTDPNAMPGFGPLGPLDDVRKLVAQVMGEADDGREKLKSAAEAGRSLDVADNGDLLASHSAEASVSAVPEIGGQDEEPAVMSSPAGDVQCNSADSAPQQEEPSPHAANVSIKRGHGGALPK